MKNKELLVGIIVLLVIAECFVILGYSTSDGGQTGNSSILKNGTGHATSGTTTKATTTATAKATTTPLIYTTNQINQHFRDIAFDPNNPTITKISSSTEKIAVSGLYRDTDKAVISNFEQRFNTRSRTLTLPSAPVESSEGNIVINFLPKSSVESLAEDTSYNSINTQQIINRDSDGTICSVYRTTVYSTSSTNFIYLNSDLTGEKRGHYIIRGLLYFLGFPGETGRYSDSIFYSQSNTVVNLSTIDMKAVEIMYGTNIQNGMSLGTVSSLYPT
jgi:hypothetical protein